MKAVLLTILTVFIVAITATPAPILDSLNLEDTVDWDDVKGLTDNLFDISNSRKGPFDFTSTYRVIATPRQVVNGTQKTGGLKGAKGVYQFAINRHINLLCYNVKLTGFRGKYESLANTATHIHEAARGASGPPRIALPNPTGQGQTKRSVGCLMGPFRTGLKDEATGKDTGRGFHVRQIERNPKAFMADVHSSLAVPGAVRGQLK